jgi:hypothetical protein
MRKSKLAICIWVPRILEGREDMENLVKVSAFFGVVCRLDVLSNMALNKEERSKIKCFLCLKY